MLAIAKVVEAGSWLVVEVVEGTRGLAARWLIMLK